LTFQAGLAKLGIEHRDETIISETLGSLLEASVNMHAKPYLIVAGILLLISQSALAAEPTPLVDAGKPFGKLPLVDEVNCGETKDAHPFAEDPKGISKIQTILGTPARVLPREGVTKYFAYLIGKGKGLKAGGAYVLSVEFPEDSPRSMFILNRGCEAARGIYTGATLGDVLYTYTQNNVESLKIPLSQSYRTWKMFFFLHERFPGIKSARGGGQGSSTPKDGFWVIIAQPHEANVPLSAGAAVSRIRLFEVPDTSKFDAKYNLPPEGLPKRHLFWREEMSDGVVLSTDAAKRAVTNPIDWFEYKARLMQFLGMNTFCKDLLEFGSNQAWDSAPYGGNDWYYASRAPYRWRDILTMVEKYKFDVLPYYEYSGSKGNKGLGFKKRARPLNDTNEKLDYTHITWTEKANADVTDPDALADAKKLLDATIVRNKDKVKFVGAWFRTRPSNLPISFSDRCLGLFAKEANNGKGVTRAQLKANKALLEKYYGWWFPKRREFLTALRDHLRSKVNPDAVVLLTPHSEEPGPGFGRVVVTDNVAKWKKLLVGPDHKSAGTPLSYEQVVKSEKYLKVLLAGRGTWGKWEWQHSLPKPDPQRYKDTAGVAITYPFNRAYTVSSAKAFDAFRVPAGLAIIRHYPLNESIMDRDKAHKINILGYFVSDMERAGPFCMLGEARAMAYGDPRFIGYMSSSNFNRGFPEYVRNFNTAFLSLPASPSEVLKDAASDPNVVVRAIKTKEHGTYLGIVNVSLGDVENVEITLPAEGAVTDAATGKPLQAPDGKLRLSLYPCQLRAVHID